MRRGRGVRREGRGRWPGCHRWFGRISGQGDNHAPLRIRDLMREIERIDTCSDRNEAYDEHET